MSEFNPNKNFSKKSISEINTLFNGILDGNRFELGKAITLIESELEEHRKLKNELINLCFSKKKSGLRIGISGAPGVGKSTLIESLGTFIISKNISPAVLTIDPSSHISGGSILGDKTRMQKLSTSQQAFVRTSPAGNALGGVGKYTMETILLVETAGFDPIIIETVGVGQSEIEVSSMSDIFILVLQPGSGDELQGIKRGIMEMADIILINKNDTENLITAKNTFNQYNSSVKLLKPKVSDWERKVMLVSAIENTGISELWEEINNLNDIIHNSGEFDSKRELQNINWFEKYFLYTLNKFIHSNPQHIQELESLKKGILLKEISPVDASDILFEKLLKNLK
ncbi:MAG: methylmalonyl Co-A mutase-associated GTPase MeaB [Saprospiraceae bacterium]